MYPRKKSSSKRATTKNNTNAISRAGASFANIFEVEALVLPLSASMAKTNACIAAPKMMPNSKSRDAGHRGDNPSDAMDRRSTYLRIENDASTAAASAAISPLISSESKDGSCCTPPLKIKYSDHSVVVNTAKTMKKSKMRHGGLNRSSLLKKLRRPNSAESCAFGKNNLA
jgi:hypothetical protein